MPWPQQPAGTPSALSPLAALIRLIRGSSPATGTYRDELLGALTSSLARFDAGATAALPVSESAATALGRTDEVPDPQANRLTESLLAEDKARQTDASSQAPIDLAQATGPSTSGSDQLPGTKQRSVALSAATAAPKLIEITYDDDTIEIRSGGTASWRNNNPTNLEYGEFSRRNGAIGSDGRFAIFPSEEIGKRAALANLSRPEYQANTINKVIEKWAPPGENDTAAYQRFVRDQTGLSGDTRLSSLTQPQLERLYEVIKRFEGWKVGHTAHGRR
jgi:hypothetical protein